MPLRLAYFSSIWLELDVAGAIDPVEAACAHATLLAVAAMMLIAQTATVTTNAEAALNVDFIESIFAIRLVCQLVNGVFA